MTSSCGGLWLTGSSQLNLIHSCVRHKTNPVVFCNGNFFFAIIQKVAYIWVLVFLRQYFVSLKTLKKNCSFFSLVLFSLQLKFYISYCLEISPHKNQCPKNAKKTQWLTRNKPMAHQVLNNVYCWCKLLQSLADMFVPVYWHYSHCCH